MLNTGSGQWVCVKTCCHFVQGKAAQESILCTPVVLAFFLRPYVFCMEILWLAKCFWAKLNKTLHSVYAQLLLLHSTAPWRRPGLSIVNQSQKSFMNRINQSQASKFVANKITYKVTYRALDSRQSQKVIKAN